MELSNRLYSRIQKYCALGDELIEKGDFDEAIQTYNKAKDLLPEPIYDWEAATWIFVAIGDAFYLSFRYQDALNNLQEAQKCYGGIGNPFILLRIGQCYYELNSVENAKKYLLQAYMIEGEEIFKNEEDKYFNIVRRDILNG